MLPRLSHRSTWSDRDLQLLRDGFAAGTPVRDLARSLGRTEEAIRRKHRLLSKAEPASAEGAYLERRATEERRLAAESNDPRVKAIHDQMSRYYDEVAAGERRSTSKEVG